MRVEGKIKEFRFVRTKFFHVSMRLNSFTSFLPNAKKNLVLCKQLVHK